MTKDTLVGLGFGLLYDAVLIGIFIGIVALVMWIGGVEHGWLHRWRPWLGITLLWLVFGFAVRILLAVMTDGMLETPGWQAPLAIILWPLTIIMMTVQLL